MGELEIYARLLDDDSVAPKVKILEAVAEIKKQQMQIAQIQAQSQIMMQRANQFLMSDPETQAQQMADAEAAMAQAEQQASAGQPYM